MSALAQEVCSWAENHELSRSEAMRRLRFPAGSPLAIPSQTPGVGTTVIPPLSRRRFHRTLVAIAN